MQKTIFITIAETSVLRNLLRTEFWDVLHSSGVHIVLVTTPELATIVKGFAGDDIGVEVIQPTPASFKEKVLIFLARNGFVSGTHLIMQHRIKAAGESRVPNWIKRILMYIIGSSTFLRSLIRRGELSLPSSADIINIFTKYTPALVFATVLTDPTLDVPLLREARRHHVLSAGMVRGWDNLTTYGLLRVLPDTYFAQNKFLAEKVVALHDAPYASIKIIGNPFFDAYRNTNLLVSRDVYCSQMQLDPNTHIVLYGAVGDYIFPHEGEIADVFESCVVKGLLPTNSSMIFRAHPAFSSPLGRISDLTYVRPDRNATYSDALLGHWDMTQKNTIHLINSIYHADVVVTAGSTLMIEAALLDKPTISVAFDGISKVPYWFSIARFHDRAVHIKALLKTGGVRVVYNQDGLANEIRTYIANPMRDKQEREILVERFAGPNRGTAGQALGRAIVQLL